MGWRNGGLPKRLLAGPHSSTADHRKEKLRRIELTVRGLDRREILARAK
jgi:hypothetical protein